MLNVGESQSILIWVRVKNDTILLIAFWLESELKMKWFCRFCWFSRFGWFCCDDSVYFADFQKTWCLTFFPSKYFNSNIFRTDSSRRFRKGMTYERAFFLHLGSLQHHCDQGKFKKNWDSVRPSAPLGWDKIPTFEEEK